MMREKRTADAVEILHKRYVAGDPKLEALLKTERINAEIGTQLYHLRTASGLSQRELADQIGMPISVIDSLENADYEGHALAIFRQIVAMLNKRGQISSDARRETASSR